MVGVLYKTAHCRLLCSKVKVKVGFLYSTAYAMTGPARCTISEVAVDCALIFATVSSN